MTASDSSTALLPSMAQVYVTPATLALLGAISALSYAVYTFQRHRKLPPGPPAVPLLGSLPFINLKAFNKDCIRLAQKYGDIFSLYLGPRLVVVLNDYSSIREAFVNRGIEFSGRPSKGDPRAEAANPYHPILGLVHSSYSPEWKRQRSNAVAILRSLGWGRSSIEQHIKDECALLVENFRQESGSFQPNRLLGISVSNIICGLLFGSRYEHGDADFIHLLTLVDNYFNGRFNNADSAFIPLLRLKKSYREGEKMLKAFNHGMFEFSQRKIAEGRQRLEEGQDPSDFVMHYLKELENAEKGSSSRIGEDWLGPVIRDFFNAGSETSTTTLCWLLMYMAWHPEVQGRLQQQLDAEFGCQDYTFALADKDRMPLLEATLVETQRLASIAPFAIPHTTMQDVEFKGYSLPKDTIVLANLYSTSTDPRLWEDPHTFNPDRFIDEEGKFSKPEFWIPYSMGRRLCLGEQLARQELILFTAYIMHTFHVQFDDDHRPESLEADYNGVRRPQPYKIRVTPRF